MVIFPQTALTVLGHEGESVLRAFFPKESPLLNLRDGSVPCTRNLKGSPQAKAYF